jgi:hypothetical protein
MAVERRRRESDEGNCSFKSMEFNSEIGLEYGEKSLSSFHCISIQARPSR